MTTAPKGKYNEPSGEAKIIHFPVVLFLIFQFVGCSGLQIKDESGTVHHIILGLGIVSVNDVNEKAMVVTNVTAIGITMSDFSGQKIGIGYSSSAVASVSSRAKDVRAEISKSPMGPIIVNVANAELKSSNLEKKEEEKDECFWETIKSLFFSW